MRYLGGKAKIAREIAAVVHAHAPAGLPIWEPFCGGLNVTRRLAELGREVIATDASVPLMALLCAVRDGWQPPSTLSESEFHAARALPVSDPLHGFAAYANSFGGCYGAGYARETRYDGSTGARELLRDVPAAAHLACVDFLAVEPGPYAVALYCDPPYHGTAGYASCAPFDHARFVERVQEWARYCVVLVSEYDFPVGRVVWQRERAACLRGREATHLERIYLVEAT